MSAASTIIELWPSAEHFGADLGLKYPSYARVMKMRGRIPTRHWDQVLTAAEGRNIPLTKDDLAAAHAVITPDSKLPQVHSAHQ